MTDTWRSYPEGEHPLDHLMAALERLGAGRPVWHDYGSGVDCHGIEFGGTLIKVSGEPWSIHDRWWVDSRREIIVLDPDEVLADPEGTARRLADEVGR